MMLKNWSGCMTLSILLWQSGMTDLTLSVMFLSLTTSLAVKFFPLRLWILQTRHLQIFWKKSGQLNGCAKAMQITMKRQVENVRIVPKSCPRILKKYWPQVLIHSIKQTFRSWTLSWLLIGIRQMPCSFRWVGCRMRFTLQLIQSLTMTSSLQ